MSLASLLKFKKRYVINGVELVYDAFDDFEHENIWPIFTLKATSLKDAIYKGRIILQGQIDEAREKMGCLSSGTFEAEVDRVLNKRGKVLYERR